MSQPRMVWTHECESCGSEWTDDYDPDGHYCYGCGIGTICDTCITVWQHWNSGLHGKGDPEKEIERLRAIEAEGGESD